MNTFSNIINRYDDMLYESRPASFSEFISNKYNEVHNQLYNDALNKYIKTIIKKYINNVFIYDFYNSVKIAVENIENVSMNFSLIKFTSIYEKYDTSNYIYKIFKDLSLDPKVCMNSLYNMSIDVFNHIYETNNITDKEYSLLIDIYIDELCKLYKRYHKIIEIKNSEYWMPSSIFVINRIAPFTKEVISLKKYWNMIQSNDNSELSDLKITNENILDSEIIEINYVTGKAKLQSRATDIIYEVPFKYLNENTNVSDDLILSNSFITKYNTL